MQTRKAIPADVQIKYVCQLTYYIDSAVRARKSLGDDGIRTIIDFFLSRYPDCAYIGKATRLTKFSDDKATTFLLKGSTTLNKFSFYSFTTEESMFYKQNVSGLFPRDDFSHPRLSNVIFTAPVKGLDLYKVLRKPEVLIKQLEALDAMYQNKMFKNISGVDNVVGRIPSILKAIKNLSVLPEKYIQVYPEVNMFISLANRWTGDTHDTHTNENEILVTSPVDVNLKDILKAGSLNFLPSTKMLERMTDNTDLLEAWLSTVPAVEPDVLTGLSSAFNLVDVQIERPDSQSVAVHLRWVGKYNTESNVVRVIERDFGDPSNQGRSDTFSGVLKKGSQEAIEAVGYSKMAKAFAKGLKTSLKYK